MTRPKSLSTEIARFFISPYFAVFLIMAGILLRLDRYLENCSFWTDEAWVAVNIMSRSWVEMFRHIPRLDDWPNRPLGFSLVEKFIVSFFGYDELAFRFFPFLSGVVVLIGYYRLLRISVDVRVLSWALAFFVFSDTLIYYSGQLKQFSSDVLAAISLYLLFGVLQRKGFERRHLWLLGISGCAAMWFSYPSVFILAALAVVAGTSFVVNKQWDKARVLAGICLLWFSNFVLIYTTVIRYSSSHPVLLKYWRNAFMPTPIWAPEAVSWLGHQLLSLPEILLLSSCPLVVTCFWLIGAAVVLKKSKGQFLIIFLPFVFTLTAAAWHKYPCEGRLLLFLVPGWLIFLAEGVSFTIQRTSKAAVWTPLIVVLLFFQPVAKAVYGLTHKSCSEGNREVFKFLADHLQSGDMFFFNSNAETAFLFYSSRFQLADKISQKIGGPNKNGDWVEGIKVGRFYNTEIDYPSAMGALAYPVYVYNQDGFFRKSLTSAESQPSLFRKDLFPSAMRYPRVWVFLAHINPELKEFILQSLAQNGKELKKFEGNGAAIYLYDLSLP